MLTSIHIQGFKGFKDTKIPELRRVNLILGGQNSGKTSLLEGVWLGCSKQTNTEDEIAGILTSSMLRTNSNFARTKLWYKQDRGQQGVSIELKLEDWTRPLNMSVFSTHPVDDAQLYRASNAAIRAEKKLDLLQLLKSIEPRLNNLENISTEEDEGTTCLHASVGLERMIPLSELGQGLNRIALIYSKLLAGDSKLALIDEIENGIHYSALPTVFEGIKNIAQSNDVQSIITTHSREAIRAASDAFIDSPDDFQVIRLVRKDDNVEAQIIPADYVAASLEMRGELR